MRIWLGIATMSLVTYLIRAVPLTLFRRKIENRAVRSFLAYVPYACLSAMTVPAVFFATDRLAETSVAFGVAFLLALRGKGLVAVAVCATSAAFAVSLLA